MRYKIVQANDPDRLSEQVAGLLNTGWRLHGGLLMTPTSSLYTQALVNEQDAPAEIEVLKIKAVRVIQDALKLAVALNPQQQQSLNEANQLLSEFAERVSRSAEIELDKE